jgi:nitrate/TMAO reductase-like tetraheme cytochrome c subunit
MNKKKLIIVIATAFILSGVGMHEASVRFIPDKTCVVCHEMRDPIKKWKESGTAKNHTNCASCHFEPGFKGWMDMNISSAKQFVAHFKRNPEDPIKPPEEPLFLDVSQEPGYWSLVPNSRCFGCKDAKNHKEIDQLPIHSKLINNIANQPCKDCHNHGMHNDQKFYEKVQSEEMAVNPVAGSG